MPPPAASLISSHGPPPASPEAHEHWMGQALVLAREAAAQEEVPIGALVVDGQGTVLGAGFNQSILAGDPTAHAEILAIRQAAARIGNYRLTGTSLYVNLEPCPMCAGAMVWARIGTLVYGAEDAKSGGVRSLFTIADDVRLNHRCQVVGQVLAEESAELLRSFFQARRKNGAGK